MLTVLDVLLDFEQQLWECSRRLNSNNQRSRVHFIRRKEAAQWIEDLAIELSETRKEAPTETLNRILVE